MSGVQNPTPALSGGNPSASVGLAAVNGVAVTYMRSDGAPALDVAPAYAFSGLAATVISQAASGAAPLTISGYSLTAAQAQSGLSFTGTLNTSGSPDVIKIAITDTARGATTQLFNIYAGASGTTSKFSVDRNGNTVLGGSFVVGGGARTNASGLFSNATSEIDYTVNGIVVVSGSIIGWSSSATNAATASDLILTRAGAGALRLGAADAAAPVAQSLQPQSVVAGTTDTAGKDYTFNASKPTGTAAGGGIIEQTAFSAKSTGSSQGTLVPRRIVNAKGKVLTSTVAASLVDITLPTLTMAGGCIRATIVCLNGTDVQSYTQIINYAVVNKGGAYTKTITADAGNDAKAVSAGTLTTVWSILNGTNKVTIQLTATTSLTPSTNAFMVYYQIENNSEQVITIL